MSNRLDLYQTFENEKDPLMTALVGMRLFTQQTYVVTAITEARLDLISYKFYNSFDYGWLIAEHNDILDPFSEVTVGKVLQIPDLMDYFRFYNRNTA
jgi:hypothetical protein